MTYTIRLYQPVDRPQVEACLFELQEFEQRFDKFTLPARETIAMYMTELLELCERHNGRIYVAEHEGIVVGMVSAYLKHEDDVLTSLNDYVYVSDIVLLPDHRGQRLGSTLLELIEAYAREVGYALMVIGALAPNDAALRTYRKFGFRDREVTLVKELNAKHA